MEKTYSQIQEEPVVHPWGEYGEPGRFKNRTNQIEFFATSGSSGYMRNGKYFDISGARIDEDDFRTVVLVAGMPEMLEPGHLAHGRTDVLPAGESE